SRTVIQEQIRAALGYIIFYKRMLQAKDSMTQLMGNRMEFPGKYEPEWALQGHKAANSLLARLRFCKEQVISFLVKIASFLVYKIRNQLVLSRSIYIQYIAAATFHRCWPVQCFVYDCHIKGNPCFRVNPVQIVFCFFFAWCDCPVNSH